MTYTHPQAAASRQPTSCGLLDGRALLHIAPCSPHSTPTHPAHNQAASSAASWGGAVLWSGTLLGSPPIHLKGGLRQAGRGDYGRQAGGLRQAGSHCNAAAAAAWLLLTGRPRCCDMLLYTCCSTNAAAHMEVLFTWCVFKYCWCNVCVSMHRCTDG